MAHEDVGRGGGRNRSDVQVQLVIVVKVLIECHWLMSRILHQTPPATTGVSHDHKPTLLQLKLGDEITVTVWNKEHVMKVKDVTKRGGKTNAANSSPSANHCTIHGHHADRMGEVGEFVEEVSLAGEVSISAGVPRPERGRRGWYRCEGMNLMVKVEMKVALKKMVSCSCLPVKGDTSVVKRRRRSGEKG